MKKRVWISILLFCICCLTACGKKTGETDRDYETGEPTLSKDAETHYQFVYPVEGDLCADINILDYGHIYIKLFPDEAEYACDNFVTKAGNGEYDGTAISDWINGYYIQGGQPLDKNQKEESIWGGGFSNEISEKLLPVRGSVCMANQGVNGTNAMQFFIVTTPADVVAGLDEPLRERYGMGLKEYLQTNYNANITDAQLNMFTTYGGAPWIYGHNTVFAQVFDGFDVLNALEQDLAENEGTGFYIKKITIYEHL
ncbi:MAG: peptidylprolyl isomerase [Lachnospiraceae bacterium]